MKKGDTIQGRSLYKGGHYLRKYGKCPSIWIMQVLTNQMESLCLQFIFVNFNNSLFQEFQESETIAARSWRMGLNSVQNNLQIMKMRKIFDWLLFEAYAKLVWQFIILSIKIQMWLQKFYDLIMSCSEGKNIRKWKLELPPNKHY